MSMEQENDKFRSIKIAGWLVGVINIFSSFFYMLLVIFITIFGSTLITQMSSFLIERAIIIAIALLVAGLFLLFLTTNLYYFTVVKSRYLIFGVYTILVPVILLFGFWPLTLINSFLNFMYGLLIGLIIYKGRNEEVNTKYYLN